MTTAKTVAMRRRCAYAAVATMKRRASLPVCVCGRVGTFPAFIPAGSTPVESFLDAVREEEPGYFCRPVPPVGAPRARLLIVGLAPGMHGANRTGRPFTGDHAGILLYRTLHKFGLASGPTSIAADDGLELLNARITNSVKCMPPANKPLPLEIKACNDFLRAELAQSREVRVILSLGAIAHAAVLRALDRPNGAHRFAHAAEHALGGDRVLLDCYHC